MSADNQVYFWSFAFSHTMRCAIAQLLNLLDYLNHLCLLRGDINTTNRGLAFKFH